MARKTRLGDNLGVRLPERIMLPPAHKAIEAAAFDRLVSRGLLAREDFDAALKESFSGKKELESILLTKYRLSKAQLGQALSEFFDCPYVPYDDRTVVDVELVKNLSFDYLRRNFWIPLRRQGPLLDILIDDIDDAERKVLEFGATRVADAVGEDKFRVFRDPAGHTFCLVWGEG